MGDKRALLPAAGRRAGLRLSVILLAGAIVAVAGCGSAAPAAAPPAAAPHTASSGGTAASPSPAPAAPSAVPTVKITYAAEAVADLPFYVAAAEGFYTAQHVKVQRIRMAPSVAVAALSKGEVQFTNSPGNVISGAVRGFPFRIVMSLWSQSPWTLVGKSSFHSVAALEGHLLGTNIPGSTPYEYLVAGLQKAHVPLNKVRILKVRGTNQVYDSLFAGRIDAGVLSPPWDAKAVSKGYRIITHLGPDVNLPYVGLGTTTAYLQAHKATIVRVIRALMQAVKWARAHPAGSAALIEKHVGVSAPIAAAAYREMRPLLTQTGVLSLDAVQTDLTVLGKTLHQKITIKASSLVDFGPLKTATGT